MSQSTRLRSSAERRSYRIIVGDQLRKLTIRVEVEISADVDFGASEFVEHIQNDAREIMIENDRSPVEVGDQRVREVREYFSRLGIDPLDELTMHHLPPR